MRKEDEDPVIGRQVGILLWPVPICRLWTLQEYHDGGGYHLSGAYCVPDSVLSTWHGLYHLILPAAT